MANKILGVFCVIVLLLGAMGLPNVWRTRPTQRVACLCFLILLAVSAGAHLSEARLLQNLVFLAWMCFAAIMVWRDRASRTED